MTAIAVPLDLHDGERSRPSHVLGDIATVAQRNLITLRRVPQLLVFSTIQPVIFVLLFRYVFGGAIRVTGVPYVDFLMPGVFAQTVTFGAMNTAVGLSADLKSGLIERFRTLPMARSGVLAGRTLADAARNVFVVILMVLVGFAVGFRVHTNVVGLLAATVLLVLFGYAMSWIFAAIGLAVGDPETAQAAAFPLLAPLVFASSAFVPVASMPGWLQPFAANQPLSRVVTASRALVLGGPTLTNVLIAFGWCALIIAIAAPLAIRKYRQAA
jgi:ABC-2 type transport system permease protein/oleandomycin transport system permease protein